MLAHSVWYATPQIAYISITCAQPLQYGMTSMTNLTLQADITVQVMKPAALMTLPQDTCNHAGKSSKCSLREFESP